jgi:ABC-2 type transport system permease protein
MFSAKRMLADLKVYSKGYVRSRVGLFFTLVFPVILILLFGAIFAGGNTGPATVYVQNQDAGLNGVNLGNTFISAMNSTSRDNGSAALILVEVPASQNFSQYLSSHSSSDGIVIPKDFTSAYLMQQPVNVTLYGDPASTTSAIVSGITMGFINAFNSYNATGLHHVGVAARTVAPQSFKYIDYLVPGLIGFSALTSPMFALVNITSTYKRDKIFKQLSLTPLTKTEWLLSKIIWYIVMTAISFGLMSAAGIFLFGAHIVFSWGILLFLLVGPFLFVSLGMLVGTASTSPESAAVVGNLITFPMMFLSGTFFPVNQMPMYLQNIAHLLPLYYMIDGLTNVMIYSNYGPALTDCLILAVLAVIVFALAVRFFRWRED